MTPPPISLSKALPAKSQEPDRVQLKAGMRFVLTDVLVSESKKYGEYAKVNGYDLIGSVPIRGYTTSIKIVTQLKGICQSVGTIDNGKLKQEVKVLVAEYKTKNGRMALELQDPA